VTAWAVRGWLASLTLAASCATAAAQTSREPYVPLANAVITAAKSDVDTLMRTFRTFASAHKFRAEEGPFPKQGRIVANLTIYLGKDSMFYVNNFIQEDKFDLVAYSHEDERVWKMSWSELFDELSSTLGAQHIEVVK
jgi:hypothetical protein